MGRLKRPIGSGQREEGHGIEVEVEVVNVRFDLLSIDLRT